MSQTHTELTEEYGIPRWSAGYWGSRFFGITGGLLMDMLAEGAATSLQAGWCQPYSPTTLYTEVPAEAVAYMAADTLLVPYAREVPHVDVIARVRDKWNFWMGSPVAGLESVLEAATGDTVTIWSPGDYLVSWDALDYWSRFWAEHEGSPATGASPVVGATAIVGDSLIIGPAGLTSDYYQRVKATTRRYKPAQWVCWDRLFRVGAAYYASMAHPRIDNTFAEQRPITVDSLAGTDAIWYQGQSASVSSWADSINSLTITQGTPGEKPTVGGGYVTFDGVNDHLVGAATSELEPSDSFYWAAVLNTSTATAGYFYAHDKRFSVICGPITLEVLVYALGGVSFGQRSYPGIASGTDTTVEVFYDRTQSVEADRLRVFVNGLEQTVLASAGDLPSVLSAETGEAFSVGAFINGVLPLACSVHDIVFLADPFDGFLNSKIRARLISVLGA